METSTTSVQDAMSGEAAEIGRALSARAFDYAQSIATCFEMGELSAKFQAVIATVGMTASASGMVSGPKRVSDNPFYFVNWPQDWMQLYDAEGYIHKDPVPRWAITSGAPIAWSELLERIPPDDPGHEIYRRVRAWNFTEGYITPVRGLDGSLGLVSVGGGRGRLNTAERLFLGATSMATHHQAEAITRVDQAPATAGAPNLQDREYLTWDRTSRATLAVDGTGWIHHMNPAAERLLLNGCGLGTAFGRLTANDPAVAEELAALIQSVSDPDEASGPGRSMSYHGDASYGAWTLTVLPARGRLVDGEAGATVFLHISNPKTEIQSQERRLRERYGLTAAEWRVAAGLYEGKSLQDLAEAFRISVNTARVQMSSIFAKTDTHRQSDLIALIKSDILYQTDLR